MENLAHLEKHIKRHANIAQFNSADMAAVNIDQLGKL